MGNKERRKVRRTEEKFYPKNKNCDGCKHFFMAQAYNSRYGEMAEVPWCLLDDRICPDEYYCGRWKKA